METAPQTAQACEEPGSAAAGALEAILENVTLARANATPICQDTGTPIFHVSYPQVMGTRRLRARIEAALAEATRRAYLRPNAVDSVTGRNSGDNLGVGGESPAGGSAPQGRRERERERACQEHGAVYKKDEFGLPEAFWAIRVKGLPVVVTMDTHGRSIHDGVEAASAVVLKRLVGSSQGSER